MSVGIALHMGTLGPWSVLANTLVRMPVILLRLSGVVMGLKRRPAGALRLASPPIPADARLWRGAVLVGWVIAGAFPMAGVVLAVALLADWLIVSRVPVLRRIIG